MIMRQMATEACNVCILFLSFLFLCPHSVNGAQSLNVKYNQDGVHTIRRGIVLSGCANVDFMVACP